MSNVVDYKELYKKYRPENWGNIVGQGAVVSSLQNAVKNDTIPTAYGFFGHHGCGKALHKSTRIPTPNGFTTMGDLKIGDYVLGSSSEPVEITDKYCPNDPVSYSLVFSDDTKVKASAGHLWTVSGFNGEAYAENTVLTTEEMYKALGSKDVFTIALRAVDKPSIYQSYTPIFQELGFNDYEAAVRHVDVFMSEVSDEILFEEDVRSYTCILPSSFDGVDNIISIMRALGGVVYQEETYDGFELDWTFIPEYIIELLGSMERRRVVINKERIIKPKEANFIVRIDRIKDNPADYFCISVDAEDELFLCTDSFIATHNTSTARVLAKALNCLSLDDENSEPCGVCESCLSIEDSSSLDVTYRSMANAGSTDDIRELCRQAMLQPTGKKAIFILDEVHNLSKAAFDALLIPLEDYSMPSLFILCSTTPEKIPATVLSRIQVRNFNPIQSNEMRSFVNGILENESIEIDDKVVNEIVRRGRGSARNTLTLLEKFLSEGDFSDVIQNEFEYAKELVKELCKHDNDGTCTAKSLQLLDEAEKNCDLENVLIHLFKVARTYIIHLEDKNRNSIGHRRDAFNFLQDLMILSGDAIDKSRKSNGLDIRIYLDYVVVSLIKNNPLNA